MAQSKSSLKQSPVKDKNASAAHSFIKDDFPLIRKALVVLVASLLSSAALVGAGKAILVKQQDGMNQAQTQRNEARNKHRQAEIDRQEIHAYQPLFIALRERGLVGEERRLDWIEQIQQIRENRKLLPIAYEISSQQVFQVGPEVALGDLELRGSKMQVQMALLHELDLLNFLSDLRRKGFYTARECTIQRTDRAQENSQSPRLVAECTLYWLTLGEPSGQNPPRNP